MAELSAARAKGHNGGRPSKLSPDQVRAARRLYDEREHTVQQIGSIFAVSRTSIYRALRDKPGRRLAPAGGAAGEVRRRQPGSRGRRDPDGGAAGDGPGHPGGAGRGDAEDAAGLVADAAVSTARGRVRCRSGSASAGAGQSDSPPRRGPALAGRGGVEETATLTDLGGGDSDPAEQAVAGPADHER